VPYAMKLPSHLSKSRYGIYYLRIERVCWHYRIDQLDAHLRIDGCP
jgi:hypothetical protein